MHSTSDSNTEPTPELILCNNLPEDYIAKLKAHTDVVNIHKYDAIYMEEHNHSLVWEYLKDLGEDIEKDRISCTCKYGTVNPATTEGLMRTVLCKNYLKYS